MFNLGITEILLIAAIGLVVLGPDQLPMIFRKAGTLIRDLKRMSNGFKAQIEDEMKAHLGPEADDLSKLAKEVRAGTKKPADVAEALEQAAKLLDQAKINPQDLKVDLNEVAAKPSEPKTATEESANKPSRAPGHTAPVLDPPKDSNPMS